jgi:predicted dehydrogenase
MIMPVPVLVGRNAKKLDAVVASLADEHGPIEWTTDLDGALADPANEIYFDSTLTQIREEGVRKAIAAGKPVYCEKPTATDTETAVALAREARAAGVKNGVVQDKLWLPGLRKLKYLIDTGFFGRILSVRGEFGYWVFDGVHQPTQRPSWKLPRRGRRRHHGRYVLPLALRDRQPLRGDPVPLGDRRDPRSGAAGREGRALRLPPPTTRHTAHSN